MGEREEENWTHFEDGEEDLLDEDREEWKDVDYECFPQIP